MSVIIPYPFNAKIPASQSWGLRSNTRTFESQFTGQIQTLETPGTVWTCDYDLPVLSYDNVRLFKSFLAKLRGQSNRFTARDFSFEGQSFPGITATGTLGAATVILNSSVNVSEGDYVSLGGQLVVIVQDSTGTTLTFEPPLRSTISSSATNFLNPTATMVLDSGSVLWETSNPNLSSVKFSGFEAIV